MSSGIYKIANVITGEFYIGSSINIEQRFKIHLKELNRINHANKNLQRTYNKYGLNNLSFEIIENVTNKNQLIDREQYYIDTLNPTYNICKTAGNTLGRKCSIKTKLKISKAHKGRKLPEEHKKRLSEAKQGNKNCLGNILSIKHKKNISDSLKGVKNPFFKKHHTELSKDKIAKANSKTYKFYSPSGKMIKGKNLTKFCRERNLNQRSMWKVLNHQLKQYKGWTTC